MAEGTWQLEEAGSKAVSERVSVIIELDLVEGVLAEVDLFLELYQILVELLPFLVVF